MKKLMFVAVASMLATMAFSNEAKDAEVKSEAVKAPEVQKVKRSMPPAMRPNGDFGFSLEAIARMAQVPENAEKLGITAEQSAKLAELAKANREGFGENQKKMRKAMEKQANLLKAKPIDEAAVMAAVDEVFELRKEAAKTQIKKVIAVRSVLTDEQVEKATAIMKESRLSRTNRPQRQIQRKDAGENVKKVIERAKARKEQAKPAEEKPTEENK